jgi:HPt (histidine-containing phosphotransfer) domain-containing protein
MLTVPPATSEVPPRAWNGLQRRLVQGRDDDLELPGVRCAGEEADAGRRTPINYEQLRQRLRGADVVVHRILGLFPDECSAGLAELHKHIKAQRWADAADVAHRLKGAAGTIAAADLRLAASRVEDACRSQDFEAVQSALLDLFHESLRTVEYVQAVVARP